MTRDEIISEVKRLEPWFHCIDLGDGLATKSKSAIGEPVEHPRPTWDKVKVCLPDDLSDKTVLDVGCNAGFYCLEMKRRGAAHVLGREARDHRLRSRHPQHLPDHEDEDHERNDGDRRAHREEQERQPDEVQAGRVRRDAARAFGLELVNVIESRSRNFIKPSGCAVALKVLDRQVRQDRVYLERLEALAGAIMALMSDADERASEPRTTAG